MPSPTSSLNDTFSPSTSSAPPPPLNDLSLPSPSPFSSTSTPGETETAITPFLVFGYGSLIYKPPPHVQSRVVGYITSHVRRFWQLSEDHRGTPDRPGRVVTLLTHDDHRRFSHSTTHTVTQDEKREEQGEDGGEVRRKGKGREERCWGVVYEIVPENVEEVKAYLDLREINGYSLTSVKVFTPSLSSSSGSSSGSGSSSSSESDEEDEEGERGEGREGERGKGRRRKWVTASVFIGTPQNPQFSPLPDTADGLRTTATHIATSWGPSGRNDAYLFDLSRALGEMGERGIESGSDAGSSGSDGGSGKGRGRGGEDWYVSELVRLCRLLQCDQSGER